MNAERLWPGGPLLLQAGHAKLTTDTVLLADFTRYGQAKQGVDLGCASGALMLLLLWRDETLRMSGIELLPEAAALAEENLRLNGLSARGRVICGDLRVKQDELPYGRYDFVVANPPYFPMHSGLMPPDADRAAARGETACTLAEICLTASRLCRSGGKIFLSYRPERLAELMQHCMAARLEPKRLRFVHHQSDTAASIVLLEARKDGNPGLSVEAPLLLVDDTGSESPEYRRIYHREQRS